MATDLDRPFSAMLDRFGASWRLALDVPQGRPFEWDMSAPDSPKDPQEVIAAAQDHALQWTDYTAVFMDSAGNVIESVSFSVSPSLAQTGGSIAKNWQFFAIPAAFVAISGALVFGGYKAVKYAGQKAKVW